MAIWEDRWGALLGSCGGLSVPETTNVLRPCQYKYRKRDIPWKKKGLNESGD